MGDLKDILTTSSVFGVLEKTDIDRLEALFDRREIHPGDILAQAENRAECFFLLGKGAVLLAMDKGKGVVLNTPGDFIGMELLSVKGIYKTTLSVLEKGYVFAVSRKDFLAVIREDSAGAEAIMEAWQVYLDNTASFAKNIEDISLPEQF